MKNACPAPDELAAFASGELSNEIKAPIELHVSQCDMCLETVGYLTSAVQRPDLGSLTHPTLAGTDQVIGPYRLIRKVGEGGMGEVWEAQQVAPIRRTVALKLLKAGMDTQQIVLRFDTERQVLALMQHPSIAQVFDAGITDAGRPYFVMEYVDGVRITAYCDQAGLNVLDRLELFKQVCEAVQHAHQKGVIHRDLKPSNVLVTRHGDKPLPKVIDFGLAKATTGELKDASLTELGTLLGTPAYASPEQMGLGAKDVDTRSDVYSLGVLLYELLVGVTPYDFDAARPGAVLDLRQAVRDRDPSRPSARLSIVSERASEIAKARNTEPKLLRKQLRGDLDWVVMKALEKDRECRYASPHELALDIDRYLNDEPLQAGPPTTTYRVGKFVRRHRVGTAFAATLAALVIGFVIVTFVQAQRIAAERDRATAEAAKANSINAFLQETLGSADPWQTGKDISIREVLANAAQKADNEFKDQPLVTASVKSSIGGVYASLGRYVEANGLLLDSLQVRTSQLGTKNLQVAETLQGLVGLESLRGNYDLARSYAARAIAIYRTPPNDREPGFVPLLIDLAAIESVTGNYDEGIKVATEAIATGERTSRAENSEVARALHVLGYLKMVGKGEFEEAKSLAHRGYEMQRRILGDSSIRVASAANDLGTIYGHGGDYEKALEYALLALRITEKELGPENPETVLCKENAAVLMGRLRRFPESIPMLEEVLDVRIAKLGDDSPTVARAMGNIASQKSEAGQLEEAQVWFERALPAFAKAYGETHPIYAVFLNRHARLQFRRARYALSEEAARKALAIQVPQFGAENPDVADSKYWLGMALMERGLFAEAEAELKASHAVRMKVLGKENEATQKSATALADLTARIER